MSMKEWIEKRIQEMKSDNVIRLENWREFYNNKKRTSKMPFVQKKKGEQSNG